MTDPILDLQWPLTFAAVGGGTTLATVVQDSEEEIRRGLELVCELRAGDLPWAEELGIPDPLGSTDPQLAADLIAAELRAIDTRPEDIRVDVVDRGDGDRNLHLRITS